MYGSYLTCKYRLKPKYFGDANALQCANTMSSIFKAQIEDPSVTMHRKNMQLILNSTQTSKLIPSYKEAL